jgi:hypothetical protein
MRPPRYWILFCLVALLLRAAFAAEFRTITGDAYLGEVSAADKDGLIVRLQTGGFSPRIDWAKLDEATLKELAGNPKARKFVEPLLDPPAEEIARIEARKIDVRQPTRVDRPNPEIAGKGIYAALVTPNGLMLLGALFLANLYAGYEIARFKWRPVPLVCGLSAVLPVVGPLIFLALPRYVPPEATSATEEAVAAQQLNLPPPPSAAPAGPPPPPGAAGLGISKHAAAPGQEGAKHFKRGETTFNRRFFETQFPSFFRVVASQADRDLVIEIVTAKGSVVGSRISRISATEIHFKTSPGAEVGVEFPQVLEVKLRNKDA